VDVGEICDEGEEGLEELELDVDALGHAVVHRLDDGRDGGERDGSEGDEALKRAEGDGDHFGVFRRAAHKDGAKEVFGMPAICSNKRAKRKSVRHCVVRTWNLPEVKFAVTSSGEDLSSVIDFSAACVCERDDCRCI
jgi:hypothetical protein